MGNTTKVVILRKKQTTAERKPKALKNIKTAKLEVPVAQLQILSVMIPYYLKLTNLSACNRMTGFSMLLFLISPNNAP